MAKKIDGYIKLQIAAGKATPSPPVGPALGSRGLNIMEFCKAFNAQTQDIAPGTPVPVMITVYSDKSFTFIKKKPPVSWYVLKAVGLAKGSSETGKVAPVAKITRKQIEEIAKEKMEDMNAIDLKGAANMIAGSAVSMGIEVEGDKIVSNALVKKVAGGKKLRQVYTLVSEIEYTIEDAVVFLKKNHTAKFNESVEVAIRTNLDPKFGDQMLRGVITLPHGTGSTVRVAAFVKDENVAAAKAAGADLAGSEELIQRIKDGKIEFDRCVATPDMMTVISQVAKILGPKGLMPNPKLGSVTPNFAEAIKTAKAGEVQFRAEKAGIVQAGVGKVEFEENALIENVKKFIGAVFAAKPSGAKGNFVKTIYLSTTMGPGLRLDLNKIVN